MQRMVPTILCPTQNKNRKKKWARSEKKDKNKMSIFKKWELFFAKKSRFFISDVNAVNSKKITQKVAAQNFYNKFPKGFRREICSIIYGINATSKVAKKSTRILL